MSATAASFNLQVAVDLTTILPDPADRVVILQVQLQPAGWDVLADDLTFEFTHALHVDDWRLHYSTDYPQGTQLCDDPGVPSFGCLLYTSPTPRDS